MSWKFVIILLQVLLFISIAEEVEQSLEVSVDNTIIDSIHMNSNSIQEEEATVHEVLDCDVFSPEGKCLENFNDLEELNKIDTIFKYMESFLSCKTEECIQQERDVLQDRLEKGDPNAQFTYAFFKKFGMYSYEKDPIESMLYLEIAAQGGSTIAQLAKGVQYQIGDRKEVNGTLMLNTILPAWRLLYGKHLSLFNALYEKSSTEWPSDVTSISYDVADYVDILKAQMSEKDFINTKRKIFLSSKDRNLKALQELYENDPSEQHFIGFMYLEGIDCEKNYTKAYQYFDNSTNPFYNTTFHVFGRGIMHFYGLGVKENKTLGCEYITQASSNSIGNSVITYYHGLCALHKHKFIEAKEKMIAASFLQFAPAIDVMLKLKESRLGSKLQMDYSLYYGSVLLAKVKDYFISIPEQIRNAYNNKDVDRALVYSFLGFYITIPYWGSHLINVYEKMVWKGLEPQFVFTTKQQADRGYKQFMTSLLSISPSNEHAVDIALSYIEGTHGFDQDIELGKKMLETSKSKDANFYLGVIHQSNQFVKKNNEMAKMNFDMAIKSNTFSFASMYYRFKIIGSCMWEKVRNHEWEDLMNMIEKVLIIKQDELLFDDNCNIITEIENNLSLSNLIQYLEEHIDLEKESALLKKDTKQLKELIDKAKEKLKEKQQKKQNDQNQQKQ